MNQRFEPSGPLRGQLRVAGDKSISHRAAIVGAMASEPVRIRGYLDAADTNSTLAAVRELGAIVEVRDGEVADPRLRPARRAGAAAGRSTSATPAR